MKKVCIIMIVALSVFLTAFAHSGGTDKNGGHYNRSTGEYHYHHGYPEHQHPGGICPYSYKDNTTKRETYSVEKSKGEEKPDDSGFPTDFLAGAGAGAAALYAINKFRRK